MRSSGGFSYIALLILVAILSMSTVMAVQIGMAVQRRAAEAELLLVGDELERALTSYRVATPAGATKSPKELEDLLLDPRFPGVRRHLRSLRLDPVTGGRTWGLIRGADGGIVAIHSVSSERPFKVANFPPGRELFSQAQTYRDWCFGDPTIFAGLPTTPTQPRQAQ